MLRIRITNKIQNDFYYISIEDLSVGSKRSVPEMRKPVSIIKSFGRESGGYPVTFLNTRLKFRMVENPHSCEMDVMVVLLLRSIIMAFSTLMIFKYSEKFIPVSFLNVFEKCDALYPE